MKCPKCQKLLTISETADQGTIVCPGCHARLRKPPSLNSRTTSPRSPATSPTADTSFDALDLPEADVKQFPVSQIKMSVPSVTANRASQAKPRGTESNGESWTVRGGRLWVKPDAVLPPLCMKTGRPVSAVEMQRIELVYSPPYLLLLIFLGPFGIPFMLLAHYSISKKCLVYAGLSQNAKARIALRKTVMGIGMFVAAISIVVIFLMGFDRTALILFLISISLVPAIILLMLAKPFSLAEDSKGSFRVSGCGRRFIATLQN